MNLDTKTMTLRLKTYAVILQKYGKIAFFLGVAAMLGFLVLRVNMLANIEPTETELEERLNTVIRPRIDPHSIEKIKQLKEQNIDIEVEFSDNRSNPFQE